MKVICIRTCVVGIAETPNGVPQAGELYTVTEAIEGFNWLGQLETFYVISEKPCLVPFDGGWRSSAFREIEPSDPLLEEQVKKNHQRTLTPVTEPV